MENKLDHFFKDKLEQREFELKDSYWAAAEQMIEADERDRRRKRFLPFWFFGIALLGIAVFYVGHLVLGDATPNNFDGKNENVVLENQSETPSNLEKDVAGDKTATLESSNAENKNNTFTNKEAQNLKNGNTLLGLENKEQSNALKNEKGNSFANSNFENKNSNAIGRVGEEQTNHDFTKTDSNILMDQKNEKASAEDQNLEAEKVVKPLLEIPAIELPKEEKAEKPIALEAFFIPSLNPFLEDQPGKVKLTPCWKPKRFSFGLTAGLLGYPFARTFDTGSTERLLGAKAGVTAGYDLNKKWSVHASVLYHFRRGNFSQTGQSSRVQYSFGRSMTSYQLTPRNVHYLEIPIYVKYKFGQHHLEGGIIASELLGVRGVVEKRENAEAFSVEDSGWVETNAFKKNFVNVMLGYHFQINERIGFGVRAVYTPGGILEKNNSDLLNESKPLYLNFRATHQLFKF